MNEMEASIEDLEAQLSADSGLSQQLEEDPVGTLRKTGRAALASFVEEVGKASTPVTEALLREGEDQEIRKEIVADPLTTLNANYGVPVPLVEPVLRGIGAPEQVLTRAGGQVEAVMEADEKRGDQVLPLLGMAGLHAIRGFMMSPAGGRIMAQAVQKFAPRAISPQALRSDAWLGALNLRI